ncbi:MAG: AtpZ/AtpI family protein [Gemmatimonadota bacterium]
MAQKRDGTPAGGSSAAGVSEYMGHGLTFAASTLLFLWLGSKADGWLGTEPWLALLGAFVGAGAGFYHMYNQLVIVPRERERAERERDGG